MSRITNRLGWGIAGALAIALLATLAGVIYAGPLAPPAAPSATGPMQIFQPSSCAGFPIVLSTPGSYVLEQNITGCSGKDGIDIPSPEVTLDLGGFELAGVPGSGYGIASWGNDLTIRNGTVRAWGSDGVGIQGTNALVTDLNSSANAGDGIDVDGVIGGGTARISHCATTGNNFGMDILSGAHAIVEGCEVANNSVGITLGGATITLSNSDVHNNTSDGIQLFGGDGTTITNNTVKSNGGRGIVAAAPGSAVMGNTVANNVTYGIDVMGDAVTVDGNTVTQNHAQGLHSVGNRDRILSNHVSGNHTTSGCADLWVTGAGTGTVVENNSAEAPAVAPAACGVIWFDAAGIIAHGNVARDLNGGAGYNVTAACTPCDIGPIGTAASSTSPWANISN